jgi:hypothetical protein
VQPAPRHGLARQLRALLVSLSTDLTSEALGDRGSAANPAGVHVSMM